MLNDWGIHFKLHTKCMLLCPYHCYGGCSNFEINVTGNVKIVTLKKALRSFIIYCAWGVTGMPLLFFYGNRNKMV